MSPGRPQISEHHEEVAVVQTGRFDANQQIVGPGYLIEFCDNLGIDLEATILRKLDKNAEKYPVERSGSGHEVHGTLVRLSCCPVAK
jgi:hypothetical protein